MLKKALLITITAAIGLSSTAITPRQDPQKQTWGYVDDNSKWVVKPKYDTAEPFSQTPDGISLSRVTHKGLIGFVDENGKLLAPGAVFESFEPLSDKAVLVKVKGKNGVTNHNLVYIIKPDITELQKLPDNSGYIASLGGKWGVFNNQGQWIVEPLYSGVEASDRGYFKTRKGDKCGIVTGDGRTLLEPKDYVDAEVIDNYLFVDKAPGKRGVIDMNTGALIVSPAYEKLSSPARIGGEYFTIFSSGDKYGLLRGNGMVIEPANTYVNYLPQSNSYLMVRPGIGFRLWSVDHNFFIEGTGELVTKNGNLNLYDISFDAPSEVIPTRVASTLSKSELKAYDKGRVGEKNAYLAKYFPSGKAGLLLSESSKILATDVATLEECGDMTVATSFSGEAMALGKDLKVYDCKVFGPTRFVRTDDNKWHLLTDAGRSPRGYDSLEPAPADSASVYVCDGGLWGMVHQGKETLEPKFAEKPAFDAALNAIVFTEGGKKGLLNTDGSVMIPALYDSFEDAGDDWKIVSSDGKFGIYDNENKLVLEPVYDSIDPEEYFLWIKKDGKYGTANLSGDVLVPVEYDTWKDNEAGDFWLGKSNQLWGVVSPYGKLILPVIYDGDLSLIEKNYYLAKGTYYNRSGEKLSNKPTVKVTSANLTFPSHSVQVNFNFDTEFLKGQTIRIEAVVLNKNGTPLIVGQDDVSQNYTKSNPYLFTTFSNQWIKIPGTMFPRLPRGSHRDYYLQLRFYDENYRPIPATGNTKLPFYYNWK